jgi:hypothetical protein
MRGLPYNGSPSADIYTQVKLIFQIQEFDGKYQKELELYLQRGQFAQGGVEVELNEAIASLLISVLLSAPKLLEIIGGLIKKVASIFAKDKGKVSAGDGFIHAGHALEGKYLKLLKTIIKVTGMGKKAGLKTDEDYDKAAKILLYTILGVAAVTAGFASVEAIKAAIAGKGVSAAVYGAAKGSLAGIKTEEIIDGVMKLASKVK